jgi:hypothetical protein
MASSKAPDVKAAVQVRPGDEEAAAAQSTRILPEVVRNERAISVEHYESLDARAGVLLGFSGAIVALAPNGWAPLVVVGTLAAMAAAIAALFAFMVRDYPVQDANALWDKYQPSSENLARYYCALEDIDIMTSMVDLNYRKARLVKLTMFLLALAVLSLGVSVLVEPISKMVK